MRKLSLLSLAAAALCMPALADEKKSAPLPDSPYLAAMEKITPEMITRCVDKAWDAAEIMTHIGPASCAADNHRPLEKLVGEGIADVRRAPLDETWSLSLQCFVAVNVSPLGAYARLFYRVIKIEPKHVKGDTRLINAQGASLVFQDTNIMGGPDFSPQEDEAAERIKRMVAAACHRSPRDGTASLRYE